MGNVEIAFDHVTKRFGSFLALDDINFEVETGEFVCIIGPAGCGKTVLLGLLSGSERPTEGDIYLRGRRINNLPAYERGIPMVFQHFALFPHRTVYQNIEYGLKVRKLAETDCKRKVADIMEKLDISELADRYPNQISGGQKQRVGLARALVVEPEILLLDEPLGSLDANLRARMQTELKNLHGRLGITFILVTSNRHEAFVMGSRVVVMDMAKIAQIGTRHELKNSPQSEYIARFCGQTNIYPGTVKGINDQFITVESPIGFVKTPNPAWNPSEGEEVKIFVQPDGVIIDGESQIAEEDDEAKACDVFGERTPQRNDNHVTGTAKFAEFSGSVITLFFELSDGSEFLVEKHASKYRHIERNEKRELYWSPYCTGVIKCRYTQ